MSSPVTTSVLLCTSGLMLLVASSQACTTDYQRGLEDPLFGAPNSLAGQKQPGPSSANTTGEGGAPTGPECVRAGGALLDGGPCAVKFSTDVLPTFKAANCQSTSCHGGAAGSAPQNLPRIDPDDPQGMWAEFAAFKLQNGKPYINPCSIDPAESTIACNVNKAAPCGSIMPPGLGLDPAAVTTIETWLKCGSPNN